MSNDASTPSRIEALDFTKGLLVVCMVAYHSLNYSTRPELGFRWLAFLPPSFIVITGFLIARVYFSRPAHQDVATRWRLWTRGAKLLAVFTGLNLLVNTVKQTNYNGQPLGIDQFLRHACDIFVLGSGNYAAFEVLLPIAYLLLLGPLWLWLERTNRMVIPLLAAVLVLTSIGLESQGALPPNLGLMSAGLLGLALGKCLVPTSALVERYWFIGLGMYSVYAITTAIAGQSYGLQLLGALIALVAMYGVGIRVGNEGWIQKRTSAMGNYSLVSYIGQIAILQLLVLLAGRPAPDSIQWLVMFTITLVAMVITAETLNWARTKSGFVDRGYRLVFA